MRAATPTPRPPRKLHGPAHEKLVVAADVAACARGAALFYAPRAVASTALRLRVNRFCLRKRHLDANGRRKQVELRGLELSQRRPELVSAGMRRSGAAAQIAQRAGRRPNRLEILLSDRRSQQSEDHAGESRMHAEAQQTEPNRRPRQHVD